MGVENDRAWKLIPGKCCWRREDSRLDREKIMEECYRGFLDDEMSMDDSDVFAKPLAPKRQDGMDAGESEEENWISTSEVEMEGKPGFPWFCYLMVCAEPNLTTKTMTHIGIFTAIFLLRLNFFGISGKSRNPFQKVQEYNNKKGRGSRSSKKGLMYWELSMMIGPFYSKEMAESAKTIWNTSRGIESRRSRGMKLTSDLKVTCWDKEKKIDVAGA